MNISLASNHQTFAAKAVELNALCSSIEHLPLELVILIIEYLGDDHETLRALARANHAFQHLAEEQLYKTIDLFSVSHLHAIIKAFETRTERARSIQKLRILYRYRPEDLLENVTARQSFNNCVAHMINLKEWHIESPFDNFNWEGQGGQDWVEHDMAAFQRALEKACVHGPVEAERIRAQQEIGNTVNRTIGLALLEKLTIHSHGANEDFWDLGNFECLFRHPRLRHLHLSCVSFPDGELTGLASHSKKTPLITLVFDECALELKSLKSILQTPANLKSLTLGENVFNIHRSKSIDPKISRQPIATLEVLSVLADSLERLIHLDPASRGRDVLGWYGLANATLALDKFRPSGEGLRRFDFLKIIECDINSFLHRAIIMNPRLAPPNLETLRIRRHWNASIDFCEQLPEISIYQALPSLSTLEIMQSTFMSHVISNQDYICQGHRLRARHASAYQLFKSGINLKFLLEMHYKPSLIPPYLYGECVPVIYCIYDANIVGFTRSLEDSLPDLEMSSNDLANRNQEVEVFEQGLGRWDSPSKAPKSVETDYLTVNDVLAMQYQTYSALRWIRAEFTKQRRVPMASPVSDSEFDEDSEGDIESDNLDIDELGEESDDDWEIDDETDNDTE